MNILQALKQLRDDLKTWVTINLNALNAKIDEKTIYIDSQLDESSLNPVQNKVITSEIADINKRVGNTPVMEQINTAIANQSYFSGNYIDLIGAPNIIEDESGTVIISDENGNIIFKADADGIHTTALTLKGESAATETYVDDAIAAIDIPEVDLTGYATEEFVGNAIDAIEFPETDLSDYYNKEETDTAISTAKEELSESIVTEADEWKIVDEAGNIIFSVDASGAHTTELTLNDESVATESYVNNAITNIKFPTTDLTDYATKKYVDDAVASIETPEVDFTGYATETYVDNKVADLVNSAPEALDTLGELATALENHEDAYDALLETVGNKATKQELEDAKTELSESIVSETDEFHIVDDAGNIVASIDANGVTTTTVTAQSVVINGNSVEEHIDDTDIHVTAGEKAAWNAKSNFSGSYNDLTDKPAPTDLSDYYTKIEVDTAIENAEADLTGYATEEYVTDAINNIDIPETDLTNYYTKTETNTAIESAKEELSESIVSEAEEWHIVDNNGNIVATIDANGINTTTVAAQNITINGLDIEELIQTRVQAYIDQSILGGEW